MKRVALILIMSLWAGSVTWVCGAESASKRGSKTAPLVSSEAARSAGLSAQEVGDGRKLYTTKCMRCHKSYEPNTYSQPEWDSWMAKMRKKAHLSPEQDTLLSRYLAAYRSVPATTQTVTGPLPARQRSPDSADLRN